MPTEPTTQPPLDPWEACDPLGEALHHLRMSGVFYSRAELTAPWAMTMPPMPGCLMFHAVTSGHCTIEVGDQVSVLQPGDFSLVPHGRGHVLLSEPGLEPDDLFDIPREQVSERYELLNYGAGGELTQMVCGAVKFDHPAARHLVELLPDSMCINTWGSDRADRINGALRLLAMEAKEILPGGEAVITRLADILVIQALRAWMVDDPAAQKGWLGALQDEQIGRAILLIHREPEREWSVASLASEVAMSRSAFAARFKERVGDSPMGYLARWRMYAAVAWLQEEDAPISELALQLGYNSEAAFSRAFKRVIGSTPGSVRRGRDSNQQDVTQLN